MRKKTLTLTLESDISDNLKNNSLSYSLDGGNSYKSITFPDGFYHVNDIQREIEKKTYETYETYEKKNP